MRSVLFSKKFKLSEARLLIVDDSQLRYNRIVEIFLERSHQVNAVLLDDIHTFEKQLATQWDIIIFGRAYDLKLEQAFTLLQKSIQPDTPILLLRDEDYHPDQYSVYLNKGVFDILNLDFSESTYVMFMRALSYSRLIQNEKQLNEELDILQQQAQMLVDESRKAVAIIQEGIHIQANKEYLKLFGLTTEDDIIGLPVLDILQPKNIPQFKHSFKKLSQGLLDQAGLEIISSNPLATNKALKLEYLPAEDDAIQLVITTSGGKKNTTNLEKGNIYSQALSSIQRRMKNYPAMYNALVSISLKECSTDILNADWSITQRYFQKISTYLQDKSNIFIYRLDSLLYLALIQAESQAALESQLMGLKSLQKPQLMEFDGQHFPLNLRIGYSIWETQREYDDVQFQQLIGQAFNTPLPEHMMNDHVTTLDFLNLDIVQTVKVNNTALNTLTSAVKSSSIAFQSDQAEKATTLAIVEPEIEPIVEIQPELTTEIVIKTPQPTVQNLEGVIESALELEIDSDDLSSHIESSTPYTGSYAVETTSSSIQPEPAVEMPVPSPLQSSSWESWSPLLKGLQQNLQHNLVTLKFQQFYDKEEIYPYTYEVSSAFIYDNAWQNLVDLEELNQAPELSIELDRWVTIEACKQLHHFVAQYPEARIIVNLNYHILFNEEFPDLISKLIHMIGGKQTVPLILQFSEQALSENVGLAQHYLQRLKQRGVEISIRDFGKLLLSKTILERIPVDYVGLHPDFSKMINRDNEVQELQQMLDEFREIRPVQMALHQLNDMTSFANAWNVDVRYIQGDYFQKKMDHLTDVQGS